MATASMENDFVIKDKDAIAKYRKALEKCADKQPRKFCSSPSLERGREKLKHFSFR